MLTRKHSIEGKQPFGDSADIFGALDADAAEKLAMVAGDVTLILDDKGEIVDGSANPDQFPEFQDWIGRDWLDTVTAESKPKIMEMLAAARKGVVQGWRHVNHPSEDGDLPVKYTLVTLDDGQRLIAFGRDLREAAKLQQRLLQVQQSLERDYLRLRHLESRYRMLFELSAEPVLIVDADENRIREANPAAHKLLGAREGSLAGNKLLGLFDRGSRENMIAHLGSALATEKVAPIEANLDKRRRTVTVSASGFSQQGGRYLLLRLSAPDGQVASVDGATGDIIERMPDAFVVADRDMTIERTNRAFVELVHAASVDQLRGRNLSEFLGRPGIDIDLIQSQIDKEGAARNVATVVRVPGEDEGEPVELSAVRTDDEDHLYGLVIRPVGRRLRDLPPGPRELPRSVDQLTDLVGRMSLKDIVRESTDLIERLCIEAALSYTSDNRASAAEILGLSRQSLYSKLHRYGLGNLAADQD